MASGITLYCDGSNFGQPCPTIYITHYARVSYARDEARTQGWSRRQGVELCPACSRREYGPHWGQGTTKGQT